MHISTFQEWFTQECTIPPHNISCRHDDTSVKKPSFLFTAPKLTIIALQFAADTYSRRNCL